MSKPSIGNAIAMLAIACLQPGACAATAYQALVQRTSYGIPHITASNERNLGYGAGYAYAQDNFCLLAEEIATARGQRSRYFGTAGSYASPDGGQIPNTASDFYYAYLNEHRSVLGSYSRQSSEVKNLIEGYAAGVNRYLRETGAGKLPATCRNQPWARPLEAQDLIRLMRRYAVTASGAQYITALQAAAPPQPGLVNKRRRPTAAEPLRGLYGRQPNSWHVGSNAIALGRDATRSSAGMLYANPHFPWNGAYRFYQQHLTIPGKVDVMGAALGGLPLVNIGFNRAVAWTHTDNTSLHSTLFALPLVPGDPLRYVVDGVAKPLRPVTVHIVGREADGALSAMQHTFYLSEQGPIVAIPGQLDWDGATAYALADANQDNDRLLDTWWRMDQARSLAELRQTVESRLGLPWVNTLATERAGNVYYGDVTVVPHVDQAKQDACVPEAARAWLSQGVMILDGGRGSCRWGQAAGTPQAGIFAARDLPAMMRRDFAQNSNDSAWLSNPAQAMTGYPDIVSIAGMPLNARTRYGIQQIQARLAGGGWSRFDMADLQALALANRSYYASLLLDDLNRLCRTSRIGQAPADACRILAGWDGKAELDSVGWPLFQAWREQMNSRGADYWSQAFDSARPLETPRGLRIEDPSVADAARAALFHAVKTLRLAGIDYAKPWGDIQVATRGSRRIPIHGGGGEDIYNVIESGPAAQGELQPVFGSSLLMTVSFENGLPRAQGFLSYSQSSDPASPHYGDQTERFSRKQWINWPYTQDEIRRDPAYSARWLWE
ncbi:penicillin acylase family protein [Chromobacterium alticapitis]|nr:penicillin acylase family protein [Chromobacterium alticapitis]